MINRLFISLMQFNEFFETTHNFYLVNVFSQYVLYVYVCVRCERSTNGGPSHTLACPTRSYISVVSKKRSREREGERKA